jgi:hypothetical protein
LKKRAPKSKRINSINDEDEENLFPIDDEEAKKINKKLIKGNKGGDNKKKRFLEDDENTIK